MVYFLIRWVNYYKLNNFLDNSNTSVTLFLCILTLTTTAFDPLNGTDRLTDLVMLFYITPNVLLRI